MIPIVTVQVGDRYPDLYVERLRRMVARRLGLPHRFVVYTDRDRSFGPEVDARDCSAWGLDGFFNKLRLFDRGITGDTPFLYLDLTLVVRDDLERLVHLGREAQASLVAVADWNYPIVNSSVMWVQPDAATQRVWEEYRKGNRFHGHIPGDQNFIDAVFRTHAPERLAFWDEGLVVSYKALRKLAGTDPEKAARALERAVILKFHGRPKPHEVLRPWLRPGATILRHPLRPALWRYLGREIEENWR